MIAEAKRGEIQEIEKELIILDVNILKLSQCIANYFIPI